MNAILDRIVDWWLRRCSHIGNDVAADILEGSWDHGRVLYCRRCGAVRIKYDAPPHMTMGEWRRPRPLWYPAAHPYRDPNTGEGKT